MILETERVVIRPSLWSDIDYFYEWETQPEVTEFFSIRDGQTKEEVIRKYVEEDNNPDSLQLTICVKEDGGYKPIGRIVLTDIINNWKMEIWRIYIGDLRYRGLGLGRDAMELILAYGFGGLQMERVYLDHYTGNPASKLYLSLGFSYEGILRKNCRKNGKLYDVHLMSILRDEYYNN